MDQLLEVIRLFLFGLFIVANCGVVIGVFFENEKNSHSTKEKGWKLLVISLACEILLSSLTFGVDSEISRRQKSKIFALETQIAPRSLTKEQYDAIQTLKGRTPTINLAVENDSECLMFATDLLLAFKNAGIKVGWYSLPSDMHFSSGLVVYDQHMSDDNTVGNVIFDAVANGGLTARLKANRLPDALDMPRDVPAILVYERLYNVPGTPGPYLGEPKAEVPAPAK